MKGYPPTVREICTELEIKSTSTVHNDIASLMKQGYIMKDPAKPRALKLVDMDDEKADEVPVQHASVVDVPLIGRIAAGTPILAEQNIEDSFPVPERFVGEGTNFMLTVKGESMI